MPILRGCNTSEKATEPEMLKDDEEVFYCEQTKEIFRNYEDFFEKVMMTSSMIWSCAMTGRPNLTYSEALQSEKKARKILKNFPLALKSAIIVVASQTKRSSLVELVDDVFNYIRERHFKNEEVEVNDRGWRKAKCLEVIRPDKCDAQTVVPIEQIKYKVEAADKKTPLVWVAAAENIRRRVLTKEKVKLFLKQNIVSVQSMLKIKENSYKQYVTDENIAFKDVFVGKLPDFEVSKRLQLQLNKAQTEPKKRIRKKKEPGEATSKKKDGTKQQNIEKYMNKTGDGHKTGDEKPKKVVDPEKEKKLKEEMERLRREKIEREAEKQRKLKEEAAAFNKEIQEFVRSLNTHRDDLEMRDQKPMPLPKPVKTLLDEKFFGDFVQILEFTNTFSELLSIKDKFPYGLTMELLERALLKKEVNGPLSDILQVLLSTIFSLQIEEENEIGLVSYMSGPNKLPDSDLLTHAGKCMKWVQNHYTTPLNELVMDSTTLSELLRLHFLASGAVMNDQGTRWRFQMRGGYASSDDPGVRIRKEYPHILKALATDTVYHLPLHDILKIIQCLIDQITTYSSVRELIEERLETSYRARLACKTLNANENRRLARIVTEKKAMREAIKVKVDALEGTSEEKAAMRDKLETEDGLKITKIDRDSEKDRSAFEKEMRKYCEQIFDYQIYLGSDRAHRNYWMFESMPGLFVEHDPVSANAGKCLTEMIENIPGLAGVPSDTRYKFVKQIMMNQKASNNKENAKTSSTNASGDSSVLAKNGVIQVDPTTAVKKDETSTEDLQIQLMMCTTNPKTCPVHAEVYAGRSHWSYFHTAEEVEALIDSLNTRGFRERALRENMEMVKDLILRHISTTKIDSLSVLPEEKSRRLAAVMAKSSKKYETADLNMASGTDPNVIVEANLRDSLLEFELKLDIGYLGQLCVKDRIEWRRLIETFEYKTLANGELSWGRVQRNGKQVGGTEDGVEDDDNNSDDESDGDEEPAEGVTQRRRRYLTIPGDELSDTDKISSDSADESYIMAAGLPCDKEKVQAMAMALLQIEQGIDKKFVLAPFRQKKDTKDKELNAKNLERTKVNVQKWEESLMLSTSFAQIFLHYNILFDSIQWSRSAERVSCTMCRSRKDPELTLLCDDCNKGFHIYCLKPKLRAIPKDDWFCKKCRPENYEKPKQNRRVKIFQVESESEDENTADETADFGGEVKLGEEEAGEESDSDFDIADSIPKCKECTKRGNKKMVSCYECDSIFHIACANPVIKTKYPRNDWTCSGCKGKKSKADAAAGSRFNGYIAEKQARQARPKTKKAEIKLELEIEGRLRKTERKNYTENDSRIRDEDLETDDDDDDDSVETSEDEQELKGRGPNRTRIKEAHKKADRQSNRSKKRVRVESDVEEEEVDEEEEEEVEDEPVNQSRKITGSRRASRKVSEEDNVKSRKSRGSVGNRASTSKRPLANGNASDSDDEVLKPKSRHSKPESPKQNNSRKRSARRDVSSDDGTEENNSPSLSSKERREKRYGDYPFHSSALYELLKDVAKHNDVWPFERPVSMKEVPDYYEVVKEPMDFARIKSKLNMGDYKTDYEFMTDVQLVFNNCDLYNTQGTEIFEAGMNLEKFMQQRCIDLNLPFRASDMLKSAAKTSDSTIHQPNSSAKKRRTK